MTRMERWAAALALAAGVLLIGAGGAAAQKQRMLMATATVRNVSLEIRVNGVLVDTFEREQFGGVPLVLWLVNGPNEVVFEGKATGPDPAATGDVALPGEKPPIAEFTWSKERPKLAAKFEGEDLPKWSWVAAPAKLDAEDALRAAAHEFHDAIAKGDKQRFREIAAAHFGDAARLVGQEKADQLRDQMWAALSKGILPLGKLTIDSYRGGQVWRVVDSTGHAPFAAHDKDNSILRFGTYWAFVDGRWQIVR